MKAAIFSFLKIFVPFALLLFFIQWGTINYVLPNVDLYYSTMAIYAFHIIITLLIYVLVVFVHHTFTGATGIAFIGGGLFKVLAAVIFLLPMLTSDVTDLLTNILSFIIPYFLFLILETFYTVKLLNEK